MLQDEMADVLWVLCCLANQTGIDLTKAIQQNMEKKTARDADRHWNNEKLQMPSTLINHPQKLIHNNFGCGYWSSQYQ